MDVLFSNAGIGESGWFEDIPFEAALRVVQVNFIGVLASIYAALPLLKATKNSLLHHLVFVGDLRHAAHRRLLGDEVRGEGTDRSALGGIPAPRHPRYRTSCPA